MARTAEEFAAKQLGSDHLFVAIARVEVAHVVAKAVVEGHALGQVEGGTWGQDRIQHEKAEFDPHPSVVSLTGLLHAVQVAPKLFLARVGSAVDSLELEAFLIAAKIRARSIEQRDRSYLAGMLHVGTTTEVHKFSVVKETDLLALGNIVQAGEFQILALPGKEGSGFLPVHSLAHKRCVLGDDLLHLFADSLEVFGGEGLLHQEIVLKLLAVVGSPGINLGFGEQALHGIGHDVLRRMANHLAALGIPSRNDFHRDVLMERRAQVHQFAGDTPGQSGLGEPGPDSLRNREHCRTVLQGQAIAVGECDFDRITHRVRGSYVLG